MLLNCTTAPCKVREYSLTKKRLRLQRRFALSERIKSPGVFADEEAIETSRICTERPGCYRPGVFADEEAIETFLPSNPYTIDQKVREYSLTKKRLRQYPPATDPATLALSGSIR